MNLRFTMTCVAVAICLLVEPRPACVCAHSLDDEKTEFSDQQLEFFENKVRPLLVERCFECHGPDASPIEGGLNLASRKSTIDGGDTGPAIVVGHPEKSLLIDAINYGEVYEMPPDTKMSDDEIEILTQWVKSGAAWPKSSGPEIELKKDFDLAARKAEHWCWQPVRVPRIPPVKNQDWPVDPIDNFILTQVERAGLTPADPTERRTLIRRVYFDIIGLPPTPEQIQMFVDDPSANAFEKVVDELLASPQFGERWARHWMDLTRYAESGGHEFDYEIRHAFRYRDYLIRAFNEDVSYKQLIHEHIAGDLLTSPRRNATEDYNESILGTGFWFLGEAKHAPVDSRGEEARTVDNQIDVMSKTFLGLTVACARCHDHKFDAISTEDYYALAGFLQSSRRQEAMLDPGGKIEAQFNKSARLVKQADEIVLKIIEQLATPDTDQVERYVNAAIEVLRSDTRWRMRPITMEGESLKQLAVSGGKTEIQTARRKARINWQGNKQFWWKQAKVGDTWELELNIPKSKTAQSDSPGRYQVLGMFTKANDYGSARISINETIVKERVDFYGEKLSTTGVLEIGEVELKPGKNVLKIELIENEQDEATGHMIGIDYLQLDPVSNLNMNNLATVRTVAEKANIEEAVLEKLVAALQDPKAEHRSHPLNTVLAACSTDHPVDAKFYDRLKHQHSSAQQAIEKSQNETELFVDFNHGLPEGWFQTGFALNGSSVDQPQFSSAGPMLHDPGTIHSGRFGSKFYGVLRSPTFELNHEFIDCRIRGNNVTIRLIIDGFMMDEFNALLFKGCKLEIKNSEILNWQRQGGDIKNHLGHRAHLEIIDHGDGFFVIDEIRFSHGAQQPDAANDLQRQLANGKGFKTQAEFSSRIATALTECLNAKGSQFNELADWIVTNDLTDMFVNSSGNKLSNVSLTVDSPAGANSSTPVADLMTVRHELEKLNANTPSPLLGIAMTEGTGEEEHIFIRGNHKTLGDVATRRFLSAISARPLNPPDGSGRLQLAQKITAPNNPLTARVAVNRIWHHMLGRGIVDSVDNFGVLGKKPTHPELLDYLALEFVTDQWSFKRMIKRIALTRTYQMDSSPNPAAQTIDPDNLLLHRARIRRLQGESIRDSILSVSGRLDLKMYGPPVPVYLTKFMDGRGRPKTGPVDGAGRRSIYISVRRNFLSPMMLAFDTPIPFNATGKRNQSNVPAQALILMNDPFVIGQAKQWAEKLVTQDESNEERIKTIYEAALSRSPTEQELEKAIAFINHQSKELGVKDADINTNKAVWQDFCHVVFNLKEFIYIN